MTPCLAVCQAGCKQNVLLVTFGAEMHQREETGDGYNNGGSGIILEIYDVPTDPGSGGLRTEPERKKRNSSAEPIGSGSALEWRRQSPQSTNQSEVEHVSCHSSLGGGVCVTASVCVELGQKARPNSSSTVLRLAVLSLLFQFVFSR